MTNPSRLSASARFASGRVAATLTAAALSVVTPVWMSLAAQTVADAEAAYARVTKSWSSTTTLRADFDQTITNPILGRTVASRGLFMQQRPNRVSIRFTEPAGDRIVGDGKHLWVYLPSSSPGQVLKLPADADGAIVADLLGQLLDTPRRAFTITGGEQAPIDGRATRRVQLVPKSAGTVPFSKAVLWIDDREPRPVRVQVLDSQGVDRTITLTSWAPNASLPKDAFAFITPKGVKVSTKLPGSR
ncbi:MAG: outer membrane lipoprotein carrier protein LolA [Gemmatimonadota bacterium]|nr:outer membrane lipoprotein carrier protein LolA [Gemmatimonadota bacterium]